MDTLVLSKVGPRLIDFYRADNRMSIAVNGPGMLFKKLELMTNRTALEGANIDFYRQVAAGLRATIACPHAPVRIAEVKVEPHRLGAELSIELGQMSMYQSLLDIQTVGGESFRALIDASLADMDTPFTFGEPTVAMLVALRVTGHQEHHASANAAIRRNTQTTHDHDDNAQGEHR